VLLFGFRPRLTVPGSAAAIVVAYLVEMIGPALNWPAPMLDVSPFHHLASVPAEPFEPVATAVMTTVGALLTAAGVLLFERRDLTGD
jgi:ABC-2 type transport system permease protein